MPSKLAAYRAPARLLLQEEASAKRAANLASYESLKQRLLATNALLVVCGSGLVGLLSESTSAAVTFGAGGAIGTRASVYMHLDLASCSYGPPASQVCDKQRATCITSLKWATGHLHHKLVMGDRLPTGIASPPVQLQA